ncbi:MAG: hypothetical protein K2Y22_17615 [Candidatus Obscuribacterales bacterium]|nr:hypothetical protein [Candidatus Obscuribacterales bacterium]
MNKKAIAKTAVLYWCEEDECYLKESPLFDSVLGVGDTPQEAAKTFSDLLDDAYEAYLEGRVPGYSRPGRPAKGGVALNSDVRPETKKRIKEIAEDFECSTGEIVDYLLFTWEHREGATKARNQKAPNKGQLEELKIRVSTLEMNLDRLLKKEFAGSKSRKKTIA